MTDPFQTWAQGGKKVTDNSQKFCPCKPVTRGKVSQEGNRLKKFKWISQELRTSKIVIPISKKLNPIPCPSVLYHICMPKRAKHSYPHNLFTWGSSENASLGMPCLAQCRDLHAQPPPLNSVAKLDPDKWKCILHWMPVYELRDTAWVLHTGQRQNAFLAVVLEECNIIRRTGHRATHNSRQLHEELEAK